MLSFIFQAVLRHTINGNLPRAVAMALFFVVSPLARYINKPAPAGTAAVVKKKTDVFTSVELINDWSRLLIWRTH